MNSKIWVVIAFIIAQATVRSYTLYLPVLAQQLGFQNLEIGLLSTVRSITQVCLLVPLGLLIDLTRRKSRLLSSALALIVIAVLVSSVANAFIVFVFTNMILAIALLILGSSSAAIITRYSTDTSAGINVSIFSIGLTAGIALGSLFGGVLARDLGIQSMYIIFGGIALLGFPVIMIWASKSVVQNHGIPNDLGKKGRGQLIRDEFALLVQTAKTQLKPIYVVEALRLMGFFGFYLFLPLFVAQLGGDLVLTGIADALSCVASIIMIFILSQFMKTHNAKHVFIFGAFGHALLLAGFLFVQNPLDILILMVFAGVTWGASQVGGLTLITLRTQDRERGRQNNVLLGSRTLGRALGAPVIGSLMDFTGDYTAPLTVASCICLSAGIYGFFRVTTTKTPDKILNANTNQPS
jgi:predicted MFS family arabinose efflux permease